MYAFSYFGKNKDPGEPDVLVAGPCHANLPRVKNSALESLGVSF